MENAENPTNMLPSLNTILCVQLYEIEVMARGRGRLDGPNRRFTFPARGRRRTKTVIAEEAREISVPSDSAERTYLCWNDVAAK